MINGDFFKFEVLFIEEKKIPGNQSPARDPNTKRGRKRYVVRQSVKEWLSPVSAGMFRLSFHAP